MHRIPMASVLAAFLALLFEVVASPRDERIEANHEIHPHHYGWERNRQYLADHDGLDTRFVNLSETSNAYWKTFVRGEAYITLQASLRLGLFESLNEQNFKYNADLIGHELNLSAPFCMVMMEHLNSLGLAVYDQISDSFALSEFSKQFLLANSAFNTGENS